MMYTIKVFADSNMQPGEIKTPDPDRARDIFIGKAVSGAMQVSQGLRDDFKIELINPDSKILKTIIIQSDNPTTNDTER